MDYRHIFDNSPTPLFILQDGYFRFANNKMAELIGCSIDQLIGLPFIQFIHPEDRVVMDNIARRSLAGENIPNDHEFRALNLEGEAHYVHGIFSCIEYHQHPALIGQIIDITRQKQVEGKLLYQLEFEKIIASISTNFINLANREINQAINQALQKIGEFVKVDRSYVFLFSENGTRMDNTNEWCAAGITPEIDNLQELPVSAFPWWMEKLNKFETIHIPCVGNLPPEANTEKQILQSQSTQSVIVVPMVYNNALIGFLGFDSVKQEKEWPEEHAALLRILGEIIVNALECGRITQELNLQKIHFQQLFENSPQGIVMLDHNDYILDANKGFEELFQYHLGEIKGRSINELIVPEHLYHESCANLKAVLHGHVVHRETLRRRMDNSIVNVSLLCYPIINGRKHVGVYAIYSDITERKMVEEALLKSEERYRVIFESTGTAMAIVEEDTLISLVNWEFEKLSGFLKEEIEGKKSWKELAHQEDVEEMIKYHHTRRANPKDAPRNYEFRFINKNGDVKNTLITVVMMPGTKKSVASLLDITERKRAEEKLKYLSMHDDLTGLYNRAYFNEEMRRLGVGRNEQVGVIVCDVDGLKLINDTMGHHAGDELLRNAGRVIKDSFREGDVVARIGGDEFAVLMTNSDKQAVKGAVYRIKNAIASHNLKKSSLPLSISVGFSVSDKTPVNINDLFKEADNNMYREKLHSSQTARDTIVKTLIKVLDARGILTEDHAVHTQEIVTALAAKIGLAGRSIADLCMLAQFRDIGKVGVPDRVLFKPGTLTLNENMEIQRHCEIGHRIALSAPDLAPIADWILKHHEWWNGNGYPLGLKGEQIPLECRIMAIADAYAAMISDRPYRSARSCEEAINDIKSSASTQFDPQLVQIFTGVIENLTLKKS